METIICANTMTLTYSDDLARPVVKRNTKPNRIFMVIHVDYFAASSSTILTIIQSSFEQLTPVTIPAERTVV